jgi:hypothetical protein
LEHDLHERSNVAAAKTEEIASLVETARNEMGTEEGTKAAEPSPELIERLRAMGYLGE